MTGKGTGKRDYRWMAVAAVGLGLLGALVVLAGQPQEKPEKKPHESATFAAPKPGPEMERVKFQLGEWKVAEKHEPMMGMPGGEGSGMVSVRPGPGGFSLITEYRSRAPFGEFTGHGLLVWDAEEKVYRAHWVDNYTPGSITMTGKWQGADLVFDGEYRTGGTTHRMRQVISDVTPNGYTMKFYTVEPGGELKPSLTMRLTRQ